MSGRPRPATRRPSGSRHWIATIDSTRSGRAGPDQNREVFASFVREVFIAANKKPPGLRRFGPIDDPENDWHGGQEASRHPKTLATRSTSRYSSLVLGAPFTRETTPKRAMCALLPWANGTRRYDAASAADSAHVRASRLQVIHGMAANVHLVPEAAR